MFSLLLFALAPVVVGIVIGLLPSLGPRFVAPIRLVAVFAAALVAVVHLLPDAWSAVGPYVLIAFLAGLTVPLLVERYVAGAGGPGSLGAKIAFGGVVVHQLVDGVQMGAVWHLDQTGLTALAVALHVPPLVAAAVVGAVQRGGRSLAATWGAALLGVTVLGVVLGARVGNSEVISLVQPWVLAGVAGALVHVAMHYVGRPRAHV